MPDNIVMENKYVKYPRTPHLPWSNPTSDDKMLKSDDCFLGKRVVVTLKLDGENTTMYNDHIHARSLESSNHPSRDWVKGLWGQISYMIDENMRVCGENLYAVHSIKYESLTSYFMVFSIWVDDICMPWDETLEYAKILSLETVPAIFDGLYDRDAIMKAFEPHREANEGYVVRLADGFSRGDFKTSIAKYVRPEFKQMVDDADGHWMTKKVEPNKLLK